MEYPADCCHCLIVSAMLWNLVCYYAGCLDFVHNVFFLNIYGVILCLFTNCILRCILYCDVYSADKTGSSSDDWIYSQLVTHSLINYTYTGNTVLSLVYTS
jgi:hypothetical protein